MMTKFTLMGLGSKNNLYPESIEEFERNYSLNSGNLLFNHAIEKLMNLTQHKFSWGTKSLVINSHKNTLGLVIPMANHLGKHIDLGIHGPKLENLDKPLLALGMGGQFELDNIDISEVPDGTIAWLKQITQDGKLQNLSVRGAITAEVLNLLGFETNYEVLGCPSLLISANQNLGQEIWKKFKSIDTDNLSLSVAAGNPFLKEYSELEKSLINLVDFHNGDYVIQHPKILIKLSQGYPLDKNDLENLKLIQNRWFSDMELNDICLWFRKKSKVYISTPQWFVDQSKKDFVVGTRIHGIQAAIQAGTPALCLYIDSRTKELCETMNIPCAPADRYKYGIRVHQIVEEFQKWDYIHFDCNRKLIAKKTMKFMQKNNADVSEHLVALASHQSE